MVRELDSKVIESVYQTFKEELTLILLKLLWSCRDCMQRKEHLSANCFITLASWSCDPALLAVLKVMHELKNTAAPLPSLTPLMLLLSAQSVNDTDKYWVPDMLSFPRETSWMPDDSWITLWRQLRFVLTGIDTYTCTWICLLCLLYSASLILINSQNA